MKLKQLFDYLPVIVFFSIFYATDKDMLLATWGIVLASVFQISVGWVIWRKVEKMHLWVFIVTAIFGTLTLVFNDETFIKWRTSIIYGVLAVLLLIGHFLQRNFLQRILEASAQELLKGTLHIAPRHWSILNLMFIGYYSALAAINLYVAYRFSTEFWMNFKLFGFTIMNMIFYTSAMVYIYHAMPQADRNKLLGEHEEPEDKPSQEDA